MNYLDGDYYVEVKDHRYRIHPTDNIISRELDPPKSLRTQNLVQNQTNIRKNQKVIKNNNDELLFQNCPKKKQPNQEQPKFKPPICTRCKQRKL